MFDDLIGAAKQALGDDSTSQRPTGMADLLNEARGLVGMPEQLTQEQRYDRARVWAGNKMGGEKELFGVRARDIKIPFASAIEGRDAEQKRGIAQKAFENKTATDEQLARLALGEYEAERNKHLGLKGQIGQAIGHAPAIVGEAMVGGAAVRGGIGAARTAAGLGQAVPAAARIGRAAQSAGTQALATPATPSLWLEESQRRANQNGGKWTDAENVLPPLFYAAATNAIMGHIGEATKGFGLAKKTAAGAALMPIEQQAADALHTVIEDAAEKYGMEKKFKMETNYGSFGLFREGKFGDLGRKLVVESVTGGMFAALHGKKQVDPAPKLAKAFDSLAKEGLPAEKAAEFIQSELAKPPESIENTAVREFAESKREVAEIEKPTESPRTANAEATPEPAKPAVEPEKAPASGLADADRLKRGIVLEGQGSQPDLAGGKTPPGWKDLTKEMPSGYAEKGYRWLEDPNGTTFLVDRDGEANLGRQLPWLGDIGQGGDRRGEARPEAIDRRINAPERKRVADMTPEERAKELLTSQVVELPNRRAFDEAGPAKVVGMSDADGLKAFNDRFGYEAGDKLLRAKAEALKATGLDAYHEKGDEFLFRGEDQKDLSAKMEKAREILKNTEIVVTSPDGKTVRVFKGADFSYGVGDEISKAESGLKGHKAEREAKGERARGELRGIAEVGPEGGREGGSPVAEKVDLNDPVSLRKALVEVARDLPNTMGDKPGKIASYDTHKVFYGDLYDAIKDRLPKGTTLDQFKTAIHEAKGVGDLATARHDLPQYSFDKMQRSQVKGPLHESHSVVFPGDILNEAKPEFGKPLTAQERNIGKIGGGAPDAPPPVDTSPMRETALANAKVDAERVENNLPPLMEAARKANAEVWDAAMAKLGKDPNLSARLVDELADKSRATTVEENALLLNRKIRLNNEYERIIRQANDSMQKGDVSEFDRLSSIADEMLGQIDKLDKVARSTGTEWGQAGQFRRQLAAEDFSLSRMMNEATRQKRSPLTPEEQKKIVDLNAEITRLNKIIADLEAVGAANAGKIGAKPKIDGMDATAAKINLNKAKRDYNEMTDAFKRSNQTPGRKVWEGIKEVNNVRRALITAYDLSAVLRQGAMLSYRHPIKAVTAFKEMLKSAKSKDYYERAEMDLRTERDNGRFGNYDRAGLYLADDLGPLTKQEEAFMGRFVGKIPGVAASSRAFNAYLNRIRADVFDGLVDNLSRDGKATHAEMKDIANFINAASGRGILRPSLDKFLTPLAHAFFSPRYLVSRMQILSGQPFFGASSWRTKKIIAKEYAGAIAGLATIYAVAKAFGSDLEKDPRSADFGKIKTGRSRLDPLAGLSQLSVIATRLLFGETKSTETGKIQDLRGPGQKFGTDDTGDKALRFTRNKMAPLAGDVSDTFFPKYTPPGTGILTDLAGKPKGTKGWAIRQADKVIPISVNDIYDAMKEQGFAKGSALSILSLLGMGSQVYDNEKKK